MAALSWRSTRNREMHRRYLPLVTVALAILGSSLPDPAAAQWIGYADGARTA